MAARSSPSLRTPRRPVPLPWPCRHLGAMLRPRDARPVPQRVTLSLRASSMAAAAACGHRTSSRPRGPLPRPPLWAQAPLLCHLLVGRPRLSPSLPLHMSSSTSHGYCPHEEDEGRPKVQDNNNYRIAISRIISVVYSFYVRFE
jgi:hypothetical protein